MSYFILREYMSKLDIILVFIALIGVFLMSIGFQGQQEREKEPISVLPIVGLALLPLLDSYGNILQRQLRELHYMTLFLYFNTLFTIMAFCWLGIEELDLEIFRGLSFGTWIIIVYFALSSFLIQTFRFLALKHEKPGKIM